VTQSQASKIRRALIKTDRLSERQNQGNLATQSHGSKVKKQIFSDHDCQTAEELICWDDYYFLVVPTFYFGT
jgi:hypothetical protein